MIAKVMAVGRDRRAAIRHLRRALDEVAVTGIQTTLPFDRALVRDEAFLRDDGDALNTDWVMERWDGAADRLRARAVAVQVAADAWTRPVHGPPSLRKDTASHAWRRMGRAAAIDRWPR
jgi:acetyl-CoA/propionyl-CoA carboxylase biotin carboxyl carrier protein